jgi:hypothetical protein
VSERDEIVSDLAQHFLTHVIDQLDQSVLTKIEWDQLELLSDICIECLLRIVKTHTAIYPTTPETRDWKANEIVDDLIAKLETDHTDLQITVVN